MVQSWMPGMSAIGFALAVIAGSARADVLVVKGNGTGDFTTVLAAVAAASDGDTILVHSGGYDGFTLDRGISLSIARIGPGFPSFGTPILIVGLPQGETVVLAGLSASGNVGSDPDGGPGLVIRDCAGAIRVQSCVFRGADGDPDGWEVSASDYEVTGHAAGWEGARIEYSDGSIAFNNCSFFGGRATIMKSEPGSSDCFCIVGEPGGDGARVIGAKVSFHGCGFDSGDANYTDWGGAGGAGVRVESGEALLAGGQATGGKGSSNDPTFGGGIGGGAGGDGAHAGRDGLIRVLQCGLAGGSSGAVFGPDGAPLGGPGDGEFLAGHYCGLGLSIPAVVGQPMAVLISGQPGDAVLLLVSLTAGDLPLPKFQGTLLVGVPAIEILLGFLPPSGTLGLTFPAPAISGLEVLLLQVQGLIGVPGDIVLTADSPLLILDGAFAP